MRAAAEKSGLEARIRRMNLGDDESGGAILAVGAGNVADTVAIDGRDAERGLKKRDRKEEEEEARVDDRGAGCGGYGPRRWWRRRWQEGDIFVGMDIGLNSRFYRRQLCNRRCPICGAYDKFIPINKETATEYLPPVV